jgi:hypothetical protein
VTAWVVASEISGDGFVRRGDYRAPNLSGVKTDRRRCPAGEVSADDAVAGDWERVGHLDVDLSETDGQQTVLPLQGGSEDRIPDARHLPPIS